MGQEASTMAEGQAARSSFQEYFLVIPNLSVLPGNQAAKETDSVSSALKMWWEANILLDNTWNNLRLITSASSQTYKTQPPFFHDANQLGLEMPLQSLES